MTDEKFYKGDLVHIGISNKIPLAQLAAMKGNEMTELGKLRLADQMAKFLVKHFLVAGDDGTDLKLEVRLTLMLTKAPEGLAKTSIIFREVPRDPETVSDLTAGGFAPRDGSDGSH
jgi:hypothetical protein